MAGDSPTQEGASQPTEFSGGEAAGDSASAQQQAMARHGKHRHKSKDRNRKKKNRKKNRRHGKNRDQVLLTLRKLFSIDNFRHQQREVIDRIMEEKDTLAVLPTGSGKSLTYQMATVLSTIRDAEETHPLTVVVSPLIALMRDQHEKLARFRDKALAEIGKSESHTKEQDMKSARLGFDGVRFDSSQTERQREKMLAEIESGQHSILLITPESLMNVSVLNRIRKRHVALFVIDEAHCVSQWGHDFRPSYLSLRDVAERLGRPAILALTATATPRVQEDIIQQLGMDVDDLMDGVDGAEAPEGESSQVSPDVREGETSDGDSMESSEPTADAASLPSVQDGGAASPRESDESASTEAASGQEDPATANRPLEKAPQTEVDPCHPRPGVITAPPDRPNLQFRVELHKDDMGKLRSVLQHVREEQNRCGIIYCATTNDVEMIYALLLKAGLNAAYYHGKLSKGMRDEQHGKFMAPGGNQVVMAATNAFGLGVDKPNIRYVIHYQVPGSLEAYVQEAGRAGRDGKPSKCILLYAEKDLEVQEYFLEQQYPTKRQVLNVANALTYWTRDNGAVTLTDLATSSRVPLLRTSVILHLLQDLGMATEVLDSAEGTDDEDAMESEAPASPDAGAAASLDEAAPAAPSAAATDAETEPPAESLQDDEGDEDDLDAFTPSAERLWASTSLVLDVKALEKAAEIYEVQRINDRQRLRELTNYATSTECRSRYIQRYFGVPEERIQPPCGKCDNDLDEDSRKELERKLTQVVTTSPSFKDASSKKWMKERGYGRDRQDDWKKKKKKKKKNFDKNRHGGGQAAAATVQNGQPGGQQQADRRFQQQPPVAAPSQEAQGKAMQPSQPPTVQGEGGHSSDKPHVHGKPFGQKAPRKFVVERRPDLRVLPDGTGDNASGGQDSGKPESHSVSVEELWGAQSAMDSFMGSGEGDSMQASSSDKVHASEETTAAPAPARPAQDSPSQTVGADVQDAKPKAKRSPRRRKAAELMSTASMEGAPGSAASSESAPPADNSMAPTDKAPVQPAQVQTTTDSTAGVQGADDAPEKVHPKTKRAPRRRKEPVSGSEVQEGGQEKPDDGMSSLLEQFSKALEGLMMRSAAMTSEEAPPPKKSRAKRTKAKPAEDAGVASDGALEKPKRRVSRKKSAATVDGSQATEAIATPDDGAKGDH